MEPAEDGGDFHIKADALTVLDGSWDALLGFPPCTHLAVSGAHLFSAKRRDGRQRAAIDFFMALANAPIGSIAIENPVGIMSTRWRKPDQIIQPYQFGEDASKKTCLWLKGLPPLRATRYVKPRMVCPECGAVLPYAAAFGKGCHSCGAEAGILKPRWANQTNSGQNRLSPGPTRATDRGRTYEGIARAMADQWGKL